MVGLRECVGKAGAQTGAEDGDDDVAGRGFGDLVLEPGMGGVKVFFPKNGFNSHPPGELPVQPIDRQRRSAPTSAGEEMKMRITGSTTVPLVVLDGPVGGGGGGWPVPRLLPGYLIPSSGYPAPKA
jgi:hypothetical protein